MKVPIGPYLMHRLSRVIFLKYYAPWSLSVSTLNSPIQLFESEIPYHWAKDELVWSYSSALRLQSQSISERRKGPNS